MSIPDLASRKQLGSSEGQPWQRPSRLPPWFTRAHVRAAGKGNPAPVAVSVFQQKSQEGYVPDELHAPTTGCMTYSLWQ